MGGARRKATKRRQLRTPRATTIHACRICAEPIAADSPETALHPDCRIEAPKCSQCGHNTAIPDPHCTACAGTGTIATSACPWCSPAPCPACVMATIIAAARRDRESHEHIGPCARCDLLSALPLGPLCADCTIADELDRTLFETVG
jgi:hypothetical protein